jgi:multidrug transporter EmrE-like cation transporter
MSIIVFCWLLLGVFLNACAQLLLKAGAQRLSDLAFSWENLLPISSQIANNPFIISGILFYAISVIIWIGVLSRVEVSMAYPMISLGYVINAMAAYYLFNEHLTITRLSGVFIILFGVFLVARS